VDLRPVLASSLVGHDAGDGRAHVLAQLGAWMMLDCDEILSRPMLRLRSPV
jgi:hypothetical protein